MNWIIVVVVSKPWVDYLQFCLLLQFFIVKELTRSSNYQIRSITLSLYRGHSTDYHQYKMQTKFSFLVPPPPNVTIYTVSYSRTFWYWKHTVQPYKRKPSRRRCPLYEFHHQLPPFGDREVLTGVIGPSLGAQNDTTKGGFRHVSWGTERLQKTWENFKEEKVEENKKLFLECIRFYCYFI